jgi:hypothetical protein
MTKPEPCGKLLHRSGYDWLFDCHNRRLPYDSLHSRVKTGVLAPALLPMRDQKRKKPEIYRRCSKADNQTYAKWFWQSTSKRPRAALSGASTHCPRSAAL